ncbi:metal ABC transporter substrate-binding protein [Desulfotomaculum nigrificans]|uniref:metal ABC transporter substrate-binding protein n=1 Tax=Desulfotomaculum nigrificans TaxID=1565 RepID=UPI0001FAE02B|nr:metal ABC transporter substrate-binding protein [Desulfotomaculum nigrificans]
MRKLAFILATLLITAGLISGCGAAKPTAQTGGKKIRVYTSIYPMYDFASQVGRDRIEIKNIVPPGGEPHEWEPTPRDIAEISKADVLIFSGAGMESWRDKVLDTIDKSRVIVVDASQGVPLIQGQKPNDEHTGSATDPHIWLDPLNAKIIVDNITAGLIKADPQNKDFYQANAANYQKELDKLHSEYRTGLKQVQIKEFITSHAAFGYLAKRYGLKQVAVRGLSPEIEPSPADMAAVVKLAREKNIKYIFFEKLVSPKVSQTIANELKAQTLLLDPMGGMTEQDIKEGHGYLYIMRQNLKNLKLALGANS